MKSLSHQGDEVIYLMQTVNLVVLISFWHTSIVYTLVLRSTKDEILLVGTVTHDISFLLHRKNVQFIHKMFCGTGVGCHSAKHKKMQMIGK